MATIDPHLAAALGDRYRLEQELGAGGMATVYLAEDVRHHRKVAVKVLRPELAAAVGHERFLREITTTANLRHPNILPLYDSGESAGFVYYVMPFVEGESLRGRLGRPERAVEIAAAAQVLSQRAGVVVDHPMDPGVESRIEALKATIPRGTRDALMERASALSPAAVLAMVST